MRVSALQLQEFSQKLNLAESLNEHENQFSEEALDRSPAQLTP